MTQNYNPAIAFIGGSPKFNKFSAILTKFVADMAGANRPAAMKMFDQAIARMRDEVWVNKTEDMFIELAGRKWRIEQKTLHHRVTLAVASATAAITQCFNTNKTASCEYLCNLTETNKMGQGEMFFCNGIALDYHADLLVAEQLRLETGGVVKLFVRGKEYFSKKACQIQGINPSVPLRSGAAQGAAASADTMLFTRGDGKPHYFNRFLRLGENTDFELQFDLQDSTAVQIAGDIEITLFGIYAVKQ